MIRKRPRQWSHAPFQLALACAAYAACSGGKGGNGIAFADFEAEFRAALCHYAVLCEEVPDQATCIASTNFNIGRSTSFFPTMQADLASGLVTYDAQAARACVDGFNNIRSCTQLEVAPLSERFEATCGAVFSGTLPPGSGCFFDEECSGRDDCGDVVCATPECCQGTCFPTPPPYPAGADCTQMPQGWSCAPGTTCDTDPTLGRICTPYLAPGADCGGAADSCPPPYICKMATSSDRWVCTPPVERGEICNDANDVFRCNDIRDNCNVTGNTCTASIPVGGACDMSGCVGYAHCVGSICVAQGGPGAGCENDESCLEDLVCDATLHCTLPPPGPSCR